MRLLYNSYEGEMRVSIKGIFDAKVTCSLKCRFLFFWKWPLQINELNSLRHEWSSKEKAEVDDIIARLEHGKKTVIELEKKKMELSQEERNLTDSLEEEELYFKSLVMQMHEHKIDNRLKYIPYSWQPSRGRLVSCRGSTLHSR